MTDAPFDRTNIGNRERPKSGDHNGNTSQIYRTICDFARAFMSPRIGNASSATGAISGMIGDGFRVVPSSPAAMTVVVSAGMGFINDPVDVPTSIGAPDLEQVNDLSPFKPLSLMSPATFAIPAAPTAPNSRIDIIEVRNGRRLTDALTRRQLDTATESFLDHVFLKTLSFGQDGSVGTVTSPASSTAALSYKIGVVGNPGVAPPTTSGYVKLAEIAVPSGTTSITGTNITDWRKLLGMNGVVHASARARLLWNGGGGAKTATVLDVCSPPSVEFAIDPQTSLGRGTFHAFFVGGAFTRATYHVQITTPGGNAVGSGESIVFTPFENVSGVGNNVGLVTAGVIQNTLANNGVLVGVGSSYLNVINVNGVLSYRNAAGASSLTDAHLEDIIVTISASLCYH